MKTIALLCENSREYGRELLKGVAHYALERRDWQLRHLSPSDIKCKSMLSGVDGIIARIIDPKSIARLKASKLPIVDAICEHDDSSLIAVDNDCMEIGRMAAEHFLRRGFRNFAYCGYKGTRYSDDRFKAFSHALSAANFHCNEFLDFEPPTNAIFFNEETKPPRNHRRIASWISSLPPRTALFCANDLRAYQVLRICQDIGRDIPRDIAVLGVDNDTILCSFASIALSSIDPNAFGVGYVAARLMNTAINEGFSRKKRPVFKVKPRQLVERQSTAVFPVDPSWLAMALEYIEVNVECPLSVADVATHVGISQTALQNAFHASFGKSAWKYIMGVKMNEAKRLLDGGTLRVKEVAARTGFTSHPHFSRAYRAHFGQPPTRQLRR